MAGSMDCQFCSKLMDIFRDLSWGPGRSASEDRYIDLGNLSDIIEMPCPHAGSIRREWEAHALSPEERLHGPQHREWTFGVKRDYEMALTLIFNKHRHLQPIFCMRTRLILRPDEAGHNGATWVLNRQWSDLSIMRTWVKRCEEKHGQRCAHPDWMKLRPESIAMPGWLVDVDNYCVVECSDDEARYPYIALSYTWGGVQCLKHTSENVEELKVKGYLHPDNRSDIPRTIRDAFEITKLLGERYLWVDSLCIPQGESTAMTKGLNSMHHIYANSIICLIAFAGTDANHGLRGIEKVSAPRHVEQVIFDIADGERLSWIPDSCKSIQNKQPDAIEGSRYIQRGWTYQEYVFAKRRLIFTDGLLHWTCQCADWSEETHGNLGINLPGNLDSESTFWMKSAGPNLVLVENAASDFNTRYFRYGEDVLKAFLGIQNHISRDFLGGFNYGHPQIFFDISLLWRVPTLRRFRSSCKRRLGGTANSDPPSWSWMGWQCDDFFFEKDEEYMMNLDSGVGFTQSVAQWYTMRNSLVPVLDLQPVNCHWQIHRAAVKNSSGYVPSGWQKIPYIEGDSYYRLKSADEGTNNNSYVSSAYDPEFEPTEFKYPIPLPANTEMCTSLEQRPFLYTRTTRSFFVAKELEPLDFAHSDSSGWDVPDIAKFPFKLLCHGGQCAGLLWLPDGFDEPSVQVELVAVVKGWTTILSHYFSVFEERKDPVSLDRPPKEYYDFEGNAWTMPSLSCFFVLCVKWENGIAKRQGTGIVEADIWERNQEPVDLILG